MPIHIRGISGRNWTRRPNIKARQAGQDRGGVFYEHAPPVVQPIGVDDDAVAAGADQRLKDCCFKVIRSFSHQGGARPSV